MPRAGGRDPGACGLSLENMGGHCLPLDTLEVSDAGPPSSPAMESAHGASQATGLLIPQGDAGFSLWISFSSSVDF